MADIVTGAGPGGGPHVKVFSGATGKEISSFLALDPSFRGGVTVAVGRNEFASGGVTGIGIPVPTIVVGSGAGVPASVSVFEGVAGLRIGAWGVLDGFAGGVTVATTELWGVNRSAVVVGAAPGGGPRVQVFDVAGGSGAPLRNFFATDAGFRGGVRVAGADPTGGGLGDIIAQVGEDIMAFRGTDLNPLFTIAR